MDNGENWEYNGKEYFRVGPKSAHLHYSLTGVKVGELTEKLT